MVKGKTGCNKINSELIFFVLCILVGLLSGCVSNDSTKLNDQVATAKNEQTSEYSDSFLICPETFPDDEFRRVISMYLDIDNSGSLSVDEINNIKEIVYTPKKVSFVFYDNQLRTYDDGETVWLDQDITSIKGIHIFDKLESLYVESPETGFGNSDIDLTGMKKLKKITLLSNDSSGVLLNGLVDLEDIEIGKYPFPETKKEPEDYKMIDLSDTPSLVNMDVSFAHTIKMDYRSMGYSIKMKGIDEIIIEGNSSKLDTVNLSLTETEPAKLEFKSNPEVKKLNLNMPIKKLDISKLENLELVTIRCSGIGMLELNNTHIKEVCLYDSSIKELSFPEGNMIEKLLLTDNSYLSHLDISNCEHLRKLYCRRNAINEIKLSKNCLEENVDCDVDEGVVITK
ncbi:MAG: hypothetical protein IKQ71_10180 [Lachnospiraceae bacterium]|nr:hypothetical protein [Lachnospiraceae bacterium]